MLDALTFDAGSTLTPDYMLVLDSRDITGNISDSGFNTDIQLFICDS